MNLRFHFLQEISVVTNHASNQVSNQVKALIFNDLESIVAFTNEVSNEVSNEVHEQVYSILNAVLHDKVEDILKIPEVKRDPTQMYKITAAGRRLLNLLYREPFKR